MFDSIKIKKSPGFHAEIPSDQAHAYAIGIIHKLDMPSRWLIYTIHLCETTAIHVASGKLAVCY